MQISSFQLPTQQNNVNSAPITKNEDVTESNKFEFKKFSYQQSYLNIDFQSSVKSDTFQKNHEEFQNFLSNIGYEGKAIGSLSQDESSALVSEDGFFGVSQTADRLSSFVLLGAKGDEDKLRAGREGIIEGFNQAETLWGTKLPQISYDTLEKALASIDEAMSAMGYSILNTSV